MNQPMQFEEPDEVSGVRINPVDVVGHLLLVWAIDYIEHSPTRFSTPDKKSDVIIVDLVDLDLADEYNFPGYLARRQWWRQGRLIQTLRPKVGRPKPMLVQMSKGTGSQGFAAPYVLVSMSEDVGSVERANEWLKRNPDFAPSTAGGFTSEPESVHTQPIQQQPAPLSRGQQSTSDLMSRLRADMDRRRQGGQLPQPPEAPF